MSLRSYSGIMMEALAFALQDREAMLDCVTDPDDLHRSRHEVSQVRALKETLKESRVDGEVPFSDIELIAEMGDPDDSDSMTGALLCQIIKRLVTKRRYSSHSSALKNPE